MAVADKLRFIDTLRGVAILMVILVHHGLSFRGVPHVRGLTSFGQMGVQLFFVASAFTLCLSAFRRANEKRPRLNYTIRRFFRIAPLYYLGIVVYALIGDHLYFGFSDPTGPDYSFVNVSANILFIHSFVPSAYNRIVPGGWSIGTEMAFYVIFPALFLMLTKLHAAARHGAIALIVLITFGLSFAGQIALAELGFSLENNQFVYCNILNQLPVFLTGMLTFLYVRHVPARGRALAAAIVVMGIGFPLSAAALLRPFSLSGAVSAHFAGLAFAGLLFVAKDLPFRLTWIESIGQRSYSMYVFHFIFAWPVTRHLVRGLSDHFEQTMLYLPTLLLAIASTYAVASASKFLIEDRFIDLGRGLIRRLETKALTSLSGSGGPS